MDISVLPVFHGEALRLNSDKHRFRGVLTALAMKANADDIQIDWENGGRGRNRTYNLSVKSRMLCQLSYASSGILVSRAA